MVAAPPPPPASSTRHAPPLTVLVVDDSDTDALLTEANLASSEGQRFVTSRARSGKEAVAAIETDPPHVVLLDYRLGFESGLDVLRDVRARGYDGVVLMLTAAGDRRVDLASTEAGADDYLDKVGLDPRLLERAIRHTRERRENERALRERNSALSRLLEEKNFFLGMAAHDLRSPLGVIAGYARLLREEPEELEREETERMLDSIIRSSEHMAALIGDLLDLSAIAAGTLVLHQVPGDLGRLATARVEEMKPLARAKQIRLLIDVEACPPVAIDEERMVQVVTNLVGNAIKYSHPESEVRVRVVSSASGVDLRVEDQGVGIAPEAAASLFQPFKKGRRTGTAGEKSVGLGLSIVRRIVEAHGGSISVESEPGRGSTFRVHLPLAAR